MNLILHNPYGLLALLALPAIVWLHRYVLWGKQRTVSCLELWTGPEILQTEGRAPRRPPLTWVLLLELLAATLLALALSGLEWPIQTAGRQPHLGILLDTSASMAGGVPGDTAYDEVLRHIEQIGADHLLSIVLSGPRPQLLGGEPLSVSEALARLRAYRPDKPHHSLEPALDMLALLVPDPDNSVMFSDDPDVQHPRLVRVGKPGSNVGIVAAQWLDETPPFVVVRRFGSGADTLTLNVVQDGSQAAALPLKFAAAEEIPFTLPVGPDVKQVDVYLPADGLAIDNHVTLLRPPQWRVSLRVAHPDPAVQQAFKRLARALPKFEPSTRTAAEVVVADGMFRIADSFAVTLPSQTGASVLAQDLVADTFNPLLTGFDPQGLVWYSHAQTPAPEAKVLLQARQTPLLWQTDNSLVFNLDWQRSNFFRHSAFPVLFYNLAEQVDAARGGLRRGNFAVGEAPTVRRSPEWGEGPLTLALPQGGSRTFQGQELMLGELDETGVYTLQAGGHTARFAVNFLDAREGALDKRAAPGAMPALHDATLAAAEASHWLNQALGLLAVVLLLTAWLLLRPVPIAAQ